MGQGNCKPQPGDLIEIDREFHQHWALYVGDGYVINMTPVGKRDVKLGVHKVTVFTRKVEKQCLKEVVKRNKWRVNNKSHLYDTPLPVEEIIQRAEDYIGKEVTYRVFGSNCEHFVTMLRYGEGDSEQLRALLGGEMQIPDMTNDKDCPRPGDLIEIKREDYQHWALYMGDGYVIHVTTIDEEVPSMSASSETIFIRKSKVTKELLEEVTGSDAWGVNNKYDCHRNPLPLKEIIRRAEGCIDKELPYDEIGSTSEDFVIKLCYGGQLRAFVSGEMQIPGMTDDKKYPKPGDLIEIEWGYYEQWALYMGDGYVIHLIPVDGVPSMSASSETTLIRKAKVMKELLKEVTGNKAWGVNNKYDCHLNPLPTEEVIWRAEGCIDKELPYDEIGSTSEDFVIKLRYGCQLRPLLGGEMQIPDTITELFYPRPGDLIEIQRGGYQHWALYVGKGYVVHVTAIAGNVPRLSAGTVTLVTKKAKVKKELLKKVAENDSWAVDNKFDNFRTPFPEEEIIRRAERWIDKVVLYRLLFKNCEHFVTMLRYGQGVSRQAMNGLESGYSISSVVTSGLALVIDSFLPAASPLAFAGFGLVTGIGLVTLGIADSSMYTKFMKKEEDILQQRCC